MARLRKTFSAKIFERALEKEITKKVDPNVKRLKTEVARAVYLSAIAGSPVFSGYFASNWRITMGGIQRVKLSPHPSLVPSKKLRRGLYIASISMTASAELAKLKDINVRANVTIANAVPYAAILEAKYGILQQARATGKQVRGILATRRI